jgi:hypothetical protein
MHDESTHRARMTVIRRTAVAGTAMICILGGVHDVSGQSVPAGRAMRTNTAPVVDGHLNEPAWAQAEAFGGLVQLEPREGLPVSERTEVRILYDDYAIYVAAWLFDSGDLVVGRAMRDAPLNDTDAFLLILDTYLDRQNGVLFATTPAGIEYDAQVINEGQGGGFNVNWDGNWRVATTRDAEGWYVEMRIPFSTLRYPKGGVQTWGLNFERRIRRKSEQAVWAPLPRQLEIQRVSLADCGTGGAGTTGDHGKSVCSRRCIQGLPRRCPRSTVGCADRRRCEARPRSIHDPRSDHQHGFRTGRG